ncbi:hypothetical protein Tco_1150611, partial [Tanacetum coccineum]
MEEILKIPGTGGRLAKWAAEIRTYSISYVRTNEAEGQMVNKFLKQKELLPHMLKGKEERSEGLVASAGKGSRTPTIEEARKYKEEIMDAAAPFHRFWITHLPKKLNSKAKVLTGLATIKLELNQEVSVGIKTRPSVEVGSDGKEGKATRK